MRGQILKVDSEGGAIAGQDGNRYTFALADFQSGRSPAQGQMVDFVEAEGTAVDVYAIEAPAPAMQTIAIAPPSKGQFLKYIGWTMIGLGVLLSMTIILAIIGVPMILVGIVMVIVASGKEK